MMTASTRLAVMDALGVLENKEQPLPLLPLARRIAELDEGDLSEQDLVQWLGAAAPGDSLVTRLGSLLARWDGERSAQWASGTSPNTQARRDFIYVQLGLGPQIQIRIDNLRPIVSGAPTIVSEDFERWFTSQRLSERSFYWRSYKDYLVNRKQWSSQTVDALDQSSTDVVERLADPTSAEDRSQRGLVVGYVQSGKTANISAVISKAVDVGYRFIIVLTGMHEALRRQTQRRLDMEVIGVPNILQSLTELEAQGTPKGDYLHDPAWLRGDFSDLGNRPPSPEIIRLTSLDEDFNQHLAHALMFKSNSMHGHLWDPENLFGIPARIAVVKKNKDVLEHLLKAMKANSTSMAEVPALIIDDESDQASINTTKPSWRTSRDSEDSKVERKRINRAISDILTLLPRAQYVGYTATPFANVFIDPDDAEDLFPKDFIIALPEPDGYMGASSFFNSVQPESPAFALDNKRAYVRELKASDRDLETQERELAEAIACFIVTGAIKLFRQHRDPRLERNYRHHTMLVHEATQKSRHREIAGRIVSIWEESDWLGPSGLVKLRQVFLDLRDTLEDRADPTAAFVDDFGTLEPFIPFALERIETDTLTLTRGPGNVALTVNSDTEVAKKMDFDRQQTWKIVVGGAMLSRGFTIEGLTVSYFRRSPRAHDTLLQMGRWFGYRPGYRDLVRIYLAENTSISRTQTVSLYDAFDSMAETEAEFRSQLSIYASWDGDSPGITPRQVVPLVRQSLPWLKPTAPNKMYNARIVSQREAVFSPKALAWEPEAVAHNWNVMQPVVSAASQHVDIYGSDSLERHVPAWAGVLSPEELAGILRNLHFLPAYGEVVVEPKAKFYEESQALGNLSDFLVLFPQLMRDGAEGQSVVIPGVGERTLAKRTRNAEDLYGEFTDPAHRQAARNFLGLGSGPTPPELLDFTRGDLRGVVLAYIIPENGPKTLARAITRNGPVGPTECSVGLTIYLPARSLDPSRNQRITWQVVGQRATPQKTAVLDNVSREP